MLSVVQKVLNKQKKFIQNKKKKKKKKIFFKFHYISVKIFVIL